MSATGAQPGLRAVAVNLAGVIEQPEFGDSPYRIDQDGRSYVPVGDGGIVLGVRLGDSAFGRDGDHVAPGACLAHADAAARHALTSYACIGNEVVVRTGAAAGAHGVVIGKRGEAGRVIVSLAPGDLARLRPADQVVVTGVGQGWRPAGFPDEVAVLNVAPAALPLLPVATGPDGVTARVRAVVPSKLAGNGIGRPAVGWCLDLQLSPADGDVLLGDLIAVADLDARWNMGYRRGWLTVGVVVHGDSPLPGHGPGITPILTGPGTALRAQADPTGHAGLTDAAVQSIAAREPARP